MPVHIGWVSQKGNHRGLPLHPENSYDFMRTDILCVGEINELLRNNSLDQKEKGIREQEAGGRSGRLLHVHDALFQECIREVKVQRGGYDLVQVLFNEIVPEKNT